MEFAIDLSTILGAAQNPFTFVIFVLSKVGWIFFIVFFIWGSIVFWLEYKRGQYDKKRQYVMLAIDIPKDNEQSPKAVEQIFAHLSGAQTTPKFEDKWIKGKLPESFSLEIISLGGYIQFLIQTPEMYRDMVEAAIYAQYPDAEIMEVEDYSSPFKGMKFPNDQYDLWGTELVLTNKEYFPIKTYPYYEHALSQEFKDPMASMMEILSKLDADEQLWFQFVITPASDVWKKSGAELVKKLIGAKYTPKRSITERITDAPVNIISQTAGLLLGGGGVQEKRPELPSLMQHLSPGERSSVEAIEIKMSKIGFNTRARFVYIAKKTAYKPDKRTDAIMGVFRLYTDLSNNGFAPHKKKKTKVFLFFKKYRLNYRKTRILRLFRMRARQYTPGYYGFILNTEELASIYHFPISTIKAPLVKRT